MARFKELAGSVLWVIIIAGLFGGICLCVRGH